MAALVRKLAIAAVLCAVTGCAADDLMLKRQAELEAKVEHLLQNDKSNQKQFDDQMAQVQVLGEQIKVVGTQVRQLQESLSDTRKGQEDLKAKVSLIVQQAATHKVELVNPEPAAGVPKAKEVGPPADYVKAFGLYSANKFAAAIEAFETFIRNNPKSDYVPNAGYWIGECYYSMNELEKAQARFQQVAAEFPKSQKAADAMLKLGYTLTALKQKDKATATYEALIKAYPGSPAAAKARERLTAH